MQAAARRRYGWVKEWVPQDLVVAGGPCALYKWVREDRLAALKAKHKEQGAESAKPEPNTEVLFLCSYEGCGKIFIDAGALRKHAHVHEERQYICHYENCGKKFLDSSKLKRHFLIHTGEKNFVCPHEGFRKVAGEPNISYICSHYYHDLELIFGAIEYTASIDIRSAGCVLAELLLGQPLFPGESAVNQLVEIIKVLGTPTREKIRCMNLNYTEFKFPQIKARPWHKLDACAHPFFDELRVPNARLPN